MIYTESAKSRSFGLSLRWYLAVFIVSSALYFIRPSEISIYVFDFIFVVGIALFPSYFLRMPKYNHLALFLFGLAIASSITYCIVDERPVDVFQAVIIFLRFVQIAICSNFLINCLQSPRLQVRDFLMPSFVALLIPLFGGLLVYFVAPDAVMAFNRYASFFANPNSFALYIVVSTSIYFTIHRAKLFPSLISAGLLVCILAVSVYSLMLSGSNSGIILFLIAVLASLVRTARAAILLFAIAVLLYFVKDWVEILILPWAQDLTVNNFVGFRRTGTLIIAAIDGFHLGGLGSYTYREQVMEYLVDQQLEDTLRVLLGLGPGQSKLLVFEVDANSVTVHNFYRLLLIEFGVVGAVSFVFLTFASLRRFLWNFDSVRLFSGILLALTATPFIYLPYYWVPLFSVLAAVTAARMPNHRMSVYRKLPASI